MEEQEKKTGDESMVNDVGNVPDSQTNRFDDVPAPSYNRDVVGSEIEKQTVFEYIMAGVVVVIIICFFVIIIEYIGKTFTSIQEMVGIVTEPYLESDKKVVVHTDVDVRALPEPKAATEVGGPIYNSKDSDLLSFEGDRVDILCTSVCVYPFEGFGTTTEFYFNDSNTPFTLKNNLEFIDTDGIPLWFSTYKMNAIIVTAKSERFIVVAVDGYGDIPSIDMRSENLDIEKQLLIDEVEEKFIISDKTGDAVFIVNLNTKHSHMILIDRGGIVGYVPISYDDILRHRNSLAN